MVSAFQQPLDIWNRACDHCGARRIATVGEDTAQYQLASTNYDKLRQSELRRNVWRFAVRRCVLRSIDNTTMLWTPPLWNSGANYAVGAIVVDANGVWWQAKIANVSVSPGGTQASATATWGAYFGPDITRLYDYTGQTTYFDGEIVLVPPAYAGGTTYSQNQIVYYTDGNFYVSLTNGNVGNTPSTDAVHWQLLSAWQATTDFGPNTQPIAIPSGFSVSLAMTSGIGDLKTPPTGISGAAGNWLSLGGTLTPLQILYPLGTGPNTDTTTANAYRLPMGFLRKAPSNPKAGINPWLGAPAGLWLDDWLFEGNYIVSRSWTSQPIMLRFVADMSYVPEMDPMFCEGLGARLGISMQPRLDQSSTKQTEIKQAYKETMGEARLVNAIEEGPEEPAEDSLLTCRI